MVRRFRQAQRRARTRQTFQLEAKRLEERRLPSNVFTVSNTLDDGSTGSLRWAINQVNSDAAESAASPDQIDFNIPQSDSGFSNGQWKIFLSSALPAITNPVVINGYTQPGSAPNTNGPGQGDNAQLTIVLDGNQHSGGLHLSGGSSTVQGLAIFGFSGGVSNLAAGYAILIDTAGGDTIEGNFVGWNNSAEGENGNGGPGVEISDVGGNTIGGTTPAARNVISDNGDCGVLVTGTSSQNNLIEGNFVGCDPTGREGVRNYGGIAVEDGAAGTTIGGTTAGAGNLIGGNSGENVALGSGATGNLVEGNQIGPDITGKVPVPGNSATGVEINDASGSTIGGTTAAAANVISGNGDGIWIITYSYPPASSNNLVEGNRIGTDPTGTTAVPNETGVVIQRSVDNTIGGTAAGAGNLISGNQESGVDLENEGTSGNIVVGNLIGTDVTGRKALGNQAESNSPAGGVVLSSGAAGNTVGGLTPGAANTIAGNSGEGVLLTQFGTRENVVAGNLIGIGTDGQTAVPNQGPGVLIDAGASDNTIGGLAAGAGNTIADNANEGVRVQDNTTIDDAILSNSILGNGALGINLVGGSENVFGVTANGPGTPQSGPNDLQNYPILGVPTLVNGDTNVPGVLVGVGNETYILQFFASPTADPSGYGQGQTYLGTTEYVTTDPSGGADFNFPASSNLTGEFITATATDLNGNTSEFSPDVPQVNVSPSASNAPVLDPLDDTGASNSDGVTFHNGTPGRMLSFTVSGIEPLNAYVQLFNVNDPSNPVPLASGETQAIEGNATINVAASTPLLDGTYKIAAAASLQANGPWSAFSPSTTVTIQTSLRVLSITPSGNYYTTLPNSGKITVTFNEPLAGVTTNADGSASPPFSVMLIPSGPDGATTEQQTGTYWSAPSGVDNGDLPVPATLAYAVNADGTSTVTLTPKVPLATDVYLIEVGGLTDLAGNAVANASGQVGTVYSSFDYRPDPIDIAAPTVTGVTAFDGSVAITNGGSIPQPDTIGIRFSEPMDTYTINSNTVHLLGKTSTNGTFVDYHDPVVYSPSTQTAYLTPGAALWVGTTYEIVVDTTVTNEDAFPNPGIPMAQQFVRTFTVNTPGAGFGTLPLTITSVNPPDGSVRTQPLGYGSISFSAPLDTNAFERFTVMMVPQTGGVTTGTSGYSDVPYNAKVMFNPGTNSLIIVPTELLPNGVVNLFAIPNVTRGYGDPLTDSHVPPGYRTFELNVSGAATPAHAISLASRFATPVPSPAPAGVIVSIPAEQPRMTRTRATTVTSSQSAHPTRPAQKHGENAAVGRFFHRERFVRHVPEGPRH